MRRPRKKDLRRVDKESQAYWTEVLRREGLSVDAGRSRRLVYVGSTQVLEKVTDMVISGTRPRDRDGDITYERVQDSEGNEQIYLERFQ